jgi:hypothetical protein
MTQDGPTMKAKVNFIFNSVLHVEIAANSVGHLSRVRRKRAAGWAMAAASTGISTTRDASFSSSLDQSDDKSIISNDCL